VSKPLIIGITGGIGSGKTTLSDLLRNENYYVYNSDLEARRLQNEHPILKKQIQEIFGNEIYTESGLNRPALAKIVFNDKNLLAKLSAIVHPAVRQDFHDWIDAHSDQQLLFLESAILFENSLYKQVDKVIVITASEQVRIRRVIKRDNVTLENVRSRMKNQLPEESKIARADFVIHSDDNMPLIDKMRKIIQELTVDN
jgi:dephospho-CoA kinase